MSYPKRLLRLRPTQGIVADTPSPEVGPAFYTSGQNVQFRHGFAQRVQGSRLAYPALPADVLNLINVRLAGGNVWVAATASSLRAVEPGTVTDVTPAAGLTASPNPYQWSSTLLNGIPVISNSQDELFYWNGNTATDFVILPGWNATESCKHVVAFKYHLFALDIDGPSGHFESLLKWSDAAQPGTIPSTWTPSASNEAGDAELSDTPGPLLCAVPLGGVLLIYKRAAVYQCDYVGGNQVFSIRKALANIGTLTRRGVCELNGQHLVVTDGDIVLTDGVNIRSIGEARQKRFLFSNLDQANYQNLFVAYHRPASEVWICFPEAGSTLCTKALVYDVAHDAFGVRDLSSVACAALGIVNDVSTSETWDSDAQAWDNDASTWNESATAAALDSFVTASGTRMTQHDTSDLVTMQSGVGRYDLTFDEPERFKFVRRLHVRTVGGSGTLYVRVGTRDTPASAIAWRDEVALTDPEQIVNVSATGRYISFEIRAIESKVWTVTGVELEAELRGYH